MLTSFTRKLKQINILLVGLIFILVMVFLIWSSFFRKESTEIIKSLEIEEVKASLEDKKNGWEPPFNYKVRATVKNYNEDFYLKKVSYLLRAQDRDGNVLKEKSGSFEIKKNEEKIIKDSINVDKKGKDLSFKITKTNWQRVLPKEISDSDRDSPEDKKDK